MTTNSLLLAFVPFLSVLPMSAPPSPVPDTPFAAVTPGVELGEVPPRVDRFVSELLDRIDSLLAPGQKACEIIRAGIDALFFNVSGYQKLKFRTNYKGSPLIRNFFKISLGTLEPRHLPNVGWNEGLGIYIDRFWPNTFLAGFEPHILTTEVQEF